MSDKFKHWDQVYQTKDHDQVSWHQAHATLSLDWIVAVSKPSDAIIDVGCGVSILADELLEKGYQDLSLLELSSSALDTLKARLAQYPNQPIFYNLNVLEFEPEKCYDLWHDRAVFHFLTKPDEQQFYLNKLKQHLKPKGYFLLATFAPDGPMQCSELDIEQYDVAKISTLLGEDFQLLKTANEQHPHPNGSTQSFNYFLFQKD